MTVRQRVFDGYPVCGEASCRSTREFGVPERLSRRRTRNDHTQSFPLQPFQSLDAVFEGGMRRKEMDEGFFLAVVER